MADDIIIKTQDELEVQVKDELTASGLTITNWSMGSRFRRLVAAFVRPVSELYQLVAEIKKHMYLKTATGGWLRAKGADEGVDIKLASLTLGNVIMGRTITAATAVSIPAGTIVKTELDASGNELRYISTAQVILPANVAEVAVPVTAELEGSHYNVGTGKISVFLTHVEGLDYVRNAADWITTLGTDDEDEELYRQRIFDEKKKRQGDFEALYKSLATVVTGVKDAVVLRNHPRGQGTIDVVIITETGVVPSALLQSVQASIEAGKELCADVLAVAAQTQIVDVTLTFTVAKDVVDLEPYRLLAVAAIEKEFQGKSIGSSFIKAAQVAKLMQIDKAKNAVISLPANDVVPSSSVLLIKGTVTVTMAREV